MAQTVKNLPAMQETGVRSLGWQDPLKKGMAVHSWYSLLENLMNRGAWWATVHMVAKSRTWQSDWTELNWSKYSVQIHSTCPQLLMPYFLISGVTKALSDLHLCAFSWRYPRGLPFPFQSWRYFHNCFLLLWPGRLLPTFWGSDLFFPRNILVSRPGECQKPYEGTGHNRQGSGHNVPPKLKLFALGEHFIVLHTL